jgi:hypothetical protein
MTMTFVYAGVALWFGLNAGFAMWRGYGLQPTGAIVSSPAWDTPIRRRI